MMVRVVSNIDELFIFINFFANITIFRFFNMPDECWKVLKQILEIDVDFPMSSFKGHFTYWNISGYLAAFKDSLEDFSKYKTDKILHVERKLERNSKSRGRKRISFSAAADVDKKEKSANKKTITQIRKTFCNRLDYAQEKGILAPSLFHLLKDKASKLLSYKNENGHLVNLPYADMESVEQFLDYTCSKKIDLRSCVSGVDREHWKTYKSGKYVFF